MKKSVYKTIFLIIIIFILLPHGIIYASMADYTDEQADKIKNQNQEEWQQEQKDRINKSSNNYLKSLSVEKYNIAPKFDKQTINYELEQEITDEYIEIKAETDDEKSSVSGTGKVVLNSGENQLRIDVTAENGTVRTYYIKINKKTNKNIKLKDIKMTADDGKEIEITPEFNEEIFEYNCTLESYIENVNIDTEANSDNLKVEISGNKNLQEGLNEVLINVYDDNYSEKIVYKINVTKRKEVQYEEEKKKNYTVICAALIIIVAFSLIILKKISKNK